MADSVASLRYLSSFMCLSNDIRFDLSIEEAKSAKKKTTNRPKKKNKHKKSDRISMNLTSIFAVIQLRLCQAQS